MNVDVSGDVNRLPTFNSTLIARTSTVPFLLNSSSRLALPSNPSYMGTHNPFSDLFFFVKSLTNPLIFKYTLLKYSSKLHKARPTGLNTHPLTGTALVHQLDAFTFTNRRPSKKSTNLTPIITLSQVIQKKVLYKLSHSRFIANVVF